MTQPTETTLGTWATTGEYVTRSELKIEIDRVLDQLTAEKTERKKQLDSIRNTMTDMDKRFTTFEQKLDAVVNSIDKLASAIATNTVVTDEKIRTLRETAEARNAIVADVADDVENLQRENALILSDQNAHRLRLDGLQATIYGDLSKPDATSIIKLIERVENKLVRLDEKIDIEAGRSGKALVELDGIRAQVIELKAIEDNRRALLQKVGQWMFRQLANTSLRTIALWGIGISGVGGAIALVIEYVRAIV